MTTHWHRKGEKKFNRMLIMIVRIYILKVISDFCSFRLARSLNSLGKQCELKCDTDS